jgi:SAM-dependent methyltransferase
MPLASLPDAPWYEGAFDRTWLRIYAHRSDEAADREAGAAIALLGLRPGARVLDIACGGGRHARGFASRGMRVTGVDLSADLIEFARERSPYLPGKPDYLRWDARRLPFVAQFDAAVSMFTSFGYFDTPDDDVAIFRSAARALVRGGQFLLDFLNEAEVRANLVAEEEKDLGTVRVRLRRRIGETPYGPAVFKHVEACDRDTGVVQAQFEERVRLYTREELDQMLAAAGLVPTGEPLGDVFGAPFGPDAPRLVRVAVRP